MIASPPADDLEMRSRFVPSRTPEPYVMELDDNPRFGVVVRELSPETSMHRQLFTVAGTGIRATARGRFRLVGAEGAPSVDAGMGVHAPVGPAFLAASAAVGRSVGARDDVDAEAAASLSTQATPWLQVGLEARMRTELVDEYKTEEDEGRRFELLAGPAATWRHERGDLKAIAGYSSPRGRAAQGAAAMLLLSFEL